MRRGLSPRSALRSGALPACSSLQDFLRADRAKADACGELKRRLALALANASACPAVKHPAVDLTCFAAERRAAQTDWHARQPAMP